MDTLPPEVLRIICTYLGFRDAANVRYLTRNLADIAAEFLVTRVAFHTSADSLERLKKISNHPIFSRTVKSLTYEAAILADIGCKHEYSRHFELDHHGLERPREPPAVCSARERRLHLRNKRKWTQNIYARYDAYRTLFESQKLLMDNGIVEKVLSRCIPKFPKLSSVDIDAARRCSHLLSERFTEEFGSDCASPLSGNSTRIRDQLTWMLLPKNYIIETLRKLQINSLSPTFFRSDRKSVLQAIFKSLTDIDIVLTLADGDVASAEDPNDSYRRHLSTGVFVEVLAAATSLEFLSIGIDSPYPINVNLQALLSNTTWTEMKSLGLSTISSTQVNFMDVLKRQPKLTSLHIALMQLTQGNWPDTLTQMRDQLKLRTFLPVGFLEDSQDTWAMDMIEVSMYADCGEEFDLSDAIDFYVTEPSGIDFPDDTMNPLKDAFEEFEDADVVREMYGDTWDSDDMSLDGMDDDEDDEDDGRTPIVNSEMSWSLSDWDEDML